MRKKTITFEKTKKLCMELQNAPEPFDIAIGDVEYVVFPEEKDAYLIFKNGAEYVKIVREGGTSWLKLHPETELPMFGMDEEVDLLGAAIREFLGG